MRTCHSLQRDHNAWSVGPVWVAVFALCVLALLFPVVSSGAPPDGGHATHIGEVAAQLDAGAFEVLDPQGFSDLLKGQRPERGGAPAIDNWSDSGQWDPKRRQSNRFLSDHARDDAWEEMNPDREQAPPRFERFGHMHGPTTLDWQRGHDYRLVGSTGHRDVIEEPAIADPGTPPSAPGSQELAPVQHASELTGAMIRAMRASRGAAELRRDDAPAPPVSTPQPPGPSPSTIHALRSGELELDDLQASGPPAAVQRPAQPGPEKQGAPLATTPTTLETQDRPAKPAPVAPGPPDSLLLREAATMEPGEFRPLNANLPAGFNSYYDFLRANSFDPDTWNDSAHWDASRQQLFLYGDRNAPVFMTYLAAVHEWRHLTLDEGPTPNHHVYGQVALDSVRGHYYRMRRSMTSDRLWRYVIDEDRWEAVDIGTGFPGKVGGYAHTDPIEWHEALDRLVYIRVGTLYGLENGRWISYGKTSVDGYHSAAQYNRARKEMLFLGGNLSSNNVAILDDDGNIHQMRDMPFEHRISNTSVTYDPITGHYLVLRGVGLNENRELWEFNPDMNKWRLAADLSGRWPFHRYGGSVPVPVDELGIIIWLNQGGPQIYRHKSVFGAPDQQPPSGGDNQVAGDTENSDAADDDLPVPALPPADYDGDHPFYALAAQMKPGEFRGVETTPFPGVSSIEKMNETNWHPDDHSSSTFGPGWSDRLIFDPSTGRLFNTPYTRENTHTYSLTWIEPDLTWNGISPAPPEARISGRRPYNRFVDGQDGYMYWMVRSRDDIGVFTRAPYDDPTQWETYGVPVGRTFSHNVGDWAVAWHPDIQKFVMYIYWVGKGNTGPEGIDDYEQGLVYAWGHGDPAWTLVGRTQSSGYSGAALYNSFHREVLLFGGTAAWSKPHPLGSDTMATIDQNGKFTRHGRTGIPYSGGNTRLSFNPMTGDYMLTKHYSKNSPTDLKMWIGDPIRGKPWELIHDWSGISVHDRERRPLHGYENWHRVTPLPGTDVLIWSDLRRGIVLQRLPASR